MPAVVDLAAMRDAMAELGGDPARINPLIPAELVIDHSVQVDEFALAHRVRAQRRARVRAQPRALRVPALGPAGVRATSRSCRPARASCHQVNLEYLARVVEDRDGVAFPDTLVGTDSHTTMVNGLGVLGWGVGGIEAEAAMLGEPLSMLVPQVVGFRADGRLPRRRDRDRPRADGDRAAAQDRRRRQVRRVLRRRARRRCRSPTARRSGTCRPSTARPAASSRSTSTTLDYLRLTGRPRRARRARRGVLQGEPALARPERRTRRTRRSSSSTSATVEPSLAGPRRPQDRVPLARREGSVPRGARHVRRRRTTNGSTTAVAETFPASDPTTEQAPGGAPEPSRDAAPVAVAARRGHARRRLARRRGATSSTTARS